MENYFLFLFMSFLLVILPGPDTGIVVQSTITYGKKNGIRTIFGSISGLLVHTMAVVFGLSAIIVKSAMVFSVLKYVGAVYLLYLGIMSLLSVRATVKQQTKSKKVTSHFWAGFITCVANPKVAMFFLTFLPQFVRNDGGNHFFDFLLLGLSYTVLTLVWFFLYVYLIDYFNRWMKKQSVQNVMQSISGVVLVFFGIKLALEKHP